MTKQTAEFFASEEEREKYMLEIEDDIVKGPYYFGLRKEGMSGGPCILLDVHNMSAQDLQEEVRRQIQEDLLA